MADWEPEEGAEGGTEMGERDEEAECNVGSSVTRDAAVRIQWHVDNWSVLIYQVIGICTLIPSLEQMPCAMPSGIAYLPGRQQSYTPSSDLSSTLSPRPATASMYQRRIGCLSRCCRLPVSENAYYQSMRHWGGLVSQAGALSVCEM